MGCDGGTIPKRDELVKTKKRPEEKDKQADSIAKWKYCALSCEKLRNPIVSCPLGRLYNKEAILQYLLDKSVKVDLVKHIRSLKDVKELNLTEKSNYEERSIEMGQNVDILDSKYICPIVGIEMNGKYKFCYLAKCGCVLSERALREVKSESCHKCGKDYDDEDIIIINPNDEEMNKQLIKLEEKRTREKLEKRIKKRKIETERIEENEATAACTKDNRIKDSKEDIKDSKKISTPSISGINRNINDHEQNTSKTTKNSTSLLIPGKATDSYSVAKDDTASEVYKSIFTSHKSAQNKPKAHWVTFNPLYF